MSNYRSGGDVARGHGAFRRQRGFTLVELMVTVAVAAILLAIAVPSFRNMMLSNRLTTVVNDMVTSLNSARMQAIKTNASAQFCSDSASANGSDALGSACASQAGAVYQSGVATPIRAAVAGLDNTVRLSGSITAVRFHGDGLGYGVGGTAPLTTATLVTICTSGLSKDNMRTISLTSGSIIATTTTTGTCG